ncbi:MAG: hypothetical protein MI919_06685 [Holophagales bacterium]|nr:hypothetical protein [Holophagales bacterium]
MRMRSTGATALLLLLSLTSLLEAAGHELLCRDEHSLPELGADLPISGVQIAPGETEHEDDCPCCGLCGSRLSLGPSSTTDPRLAVAEIQAAGPGALFLEPSPASYLSRGPPAR